jgi:hypothetical protein
MWNYYAHTQGGQVVLKWNEIHANGNMPPLLRNAVRKGKASKWKLWHGGETPKSRHQHQMLVGEQEQTSTKLPKGYLHWQMVLCVKCLMNHKILKATTNVELLRTHTRGRDSIKVEWISRKREYAIVSKEYNKERKSFTKGTDAWGSNTPIMTSTTNVTRKSRANLHKLTPRLPPLVVGLVGEGLVIARFIGRVQAA